MRYNNRPQFQYTENEMWAHVAGLGPAMLKNRVRYGHFLDILIAHAPPHGIHDAPDLPHRGFKSLLWLIEHYRPRYFIHGHVHVYDSREEVVTAHGATTIVNAYGYQMLEIEPLVRTK